MYPFAGIAFEGLLLLCCICGVGSSACGCGAGLAIIIRSSSRRWCGGSWKHKGKLRIACLLLLVLAALTNQSRRFGFRLSLSSQMARRGIPAFSSQHVAHRGDRAAAPLPPFGTAHSASGVSESAGGRSTAQLVRSQRPAGLPAAPSQATARRPTSQLLQRAYVCVVLPDALLRRIERDPPCRLPRARSKASALLRWDGDVGRKEPHGTTTPRRSAGATIAFLFYLKCRL